MFGHGNGPAHPQKCRKHGSILTPEGLCRACRWEDRMHLHAEFAEIVAPLRAEGGPFAKTPRLGDLK